MVGKKTTANKNAHRKARRIPKKVQIILKEMREELQRIYLNRLKDMILFGSYARGDFVEGSDQDSYVEREKYFPVICRISLEYDTVVSVIPFDYREFQVKRTPLILNVQKEGVHL
jgi:predicted nucleotidyltransferase